MVDFKNPKATSRTLNFFTDASLNKHFGIGGFFDPDWIFAKWQPGWIRSHKPSIAFCELYALCIGVFAWQERLTNARITIFCDNTSVRDMVNDNTSGCRNCMYLLRLLTLNNFIHNRRIHVEYIASKENSLSDSLSRMSIKRFHREAAKAGFVPARHPTALPEQIWPPSKIWLNQ